MNKRLDDAGKLLLRVLVGGLILLHGIHKIRHGLGYVDSRLAADGSPSVLAWGVYLGEVGGPLLVISGVFARVGGLLIFVNMVVAVLLRHGGHVWYLTPGGGWSIELEAFYGLCGLAVAALGAGAYAVMRPGRWN